MDRLEPWEIRDAVEDGTRAALGLPRADRGSCPAPARGFAILRFGFDDDPKAPKVSLMDDIVAGVKPNSD
ncbi:hypothetical protein [Actinoallomurus sp. NPDC052274]|uniref:hypothetical protein n=1 Tax=Actinoallomurus sp. NPDC052274 TaxID=3155420 RepID=UPI00341C478B